MDNVFWDTICGMLPWFRILALIDAVVLVLLSFSFLYTDPGSGPFIAALMTLIIVVISLVVYGFIAHRCAAREEITFDSTDDN